MLELAKEQASKALIVDFRTDILYGYDVDGMYYPRNFATVGFGLCPTDELIALADKLRIKEGYSSVLPPSYRDYGSKEFDTSGYFDFYFGINLRDAPDVDNYIECIINTDKADDHRSYLIPLSKDAKEEAWRILDAQFQKELGKGCTELLEESQKELKED